MSAKKSGMGANSQQDNIDDIFLYYQMNDEDDRVLRQQVEFIVTTAILNSTLSPGSHILEVGAGTGRYTAELLNMGCQVTALEFVPELAEKIKGNLLDSEHGKNLNVVVGDARLQAESLPSEFDAVLIMGPLYHLINNEEREALFNSLCSKVKNGGLVLSSHLSRIGFFSYMLNRFPDWPYKSPEQVEEMMSNGFVADHPRDGSFRGYFTTLDEIISIHQKASLVDLKLYSQDPLIGGNDELFNQLNPKCKERWVNILLDACMDPLSLGSGRSLLAVARKEHS